MRTEIGSDPPITQEQQQQKRTQAMASPRSQRASQQKNEDSQEEDGVLDKPTAQEAMNARTYQKKSTCQEIKKSRKNNPT
jgi:hypothetical protein